MPSNLAFKKIFLCKMKTKKRSSLVKFSCIVLFTWPQNVFDKLNWTWARRGWGLLLNSNANFEEQKPTLLYKFDDIKTRPGFDVIDFSWF